jgi:hypothetical protein
VIEPLAPNVSAPRHDCYLPKTRVETAGEKGKTWANREFRVARTSRPTWGLNPYAADLSIGSRGLADGPTFRSHVRSGISNQR